MEIYSIYLCRNHELDYFTWQECGIELEWKPFNHADVVKSKTSVKLRRLIEPANVCFSVTQTVYYTLLYFAVCRWNLATFSFQREY